MDVYEGKEPYIFISYSHKDRDTMLWLAEELQKHSNVWYDNGIRAGNEWADKIADRLLNCSLFLFLVSPNSLASDNCKDELALARDSNKPFINIRLSDVEFEGGMQLRYGRYQYFDLFLYNDPSCAVRELFKSENFDSVRSKREMLKQWVDHAETIMANTEEMASNINNTSANPFAKFGSVDTTVEFGRYKGSALRWNIAQVDKGQALLISADIVEAMAFDIAEEAYKDSQLRVWLNTEFVENAFDDEERKLLCSAAKSGEDDLCDVVSLLSYSQAKSLFRSDEDRIKKGTDHARGNGLITNSAGHGWWWLSSSEEKTGCIYRVYSNGRIGYDSDCDNAAIGVVPIIKVMIN